MDEDWHAICQAMYKGVEGEEWERMYHNYKELHQAAKFLKPGESKKAKALWSLKEADFHDLGSVQKIQTRLQLTLDLWAIHLKSPTAALAGALRRTEDGAGRGRSSSAGRSEA